MLYTFKYHIFSCCTFNICENVFPYLKIAISVCVVCMSFEINEFKHYAMHTQHNTLMYTYKIGSIILYMWCGKF